MTSARGPEPSGVHGRTRAVDSVRSRGLALATLIVIAVGALLYRSATAPRGSTPTNEVSSSPSASELASAGASPSAEPSEASPAAPTPIVGQAGARPGVPASLQDRWWISSSAAVRYWPWAGDVESIVAGVLGSTAVIVLPPSEERGAGAGDARIVTVIRGDNVSTILVRSFDDGSLLKAIETPMIVRDEVLVGARLLWSGVLVDGTTLLDGGTWAVDLSAADAEPIQVIEPLSDLERFGEDGIADYGEWVVSATGDTAVTWLGGGTVIQGYVIDVNTFSVRGTFIDAAPQAVTEDAVLLLVPDKLTLQDITTGERAWTIDTPRYGPTEYLSRPVLRDGEFILGFDRDADTNVIAAIDLVSGALRDLVVQSRTSGADILYLVPELSSADALVLLPDQSFSLGPRGEVSASLFDPETGTISRDAFTIGDGS